MEIKIEEALVRADKALKERDLAQANRLLSGILSANPHHPHANYKLGMVALELGEIDKAFFLLNRAVGVEKKEPHLWINYINTLMKLNLHKDAKIALKEALINLPKSTKLKILDEKIKKITKNTRKVKIKSGLPQNQKNLLLRLYNMGKYDVLINSANQMTNHDIELTFLFNIMGASHNAKGEYDKAITLYRKAIETNPQYAEGYNNMGSAFHNKNDLFSACDCYKKAIAIQPKYPEAFFNLGNVYFVQGKLQLAINSFKDAIKIRPNFVNAYNNLGNSYQDIGNMVLAKSCYEKVLKFNPDNAEAIYNLHSTSNTISEAKNYLRKCLDIDPTHVKAGMTLACFEAIKGNMKLYERYDQSSLAEHYFFQSVKWYLSLSNNPEIYFNRWSFFDFIASICKKSRPFYEFGVWRGIAFKYLLNYFSKGYGFDTFEGLPEDWHNTKSGMYSGEGRVPEMDGGTFVVGKFKDTVPKFFAKKRPLASLVNFDSDLYSSTKCALDNAISVIDAHTVLIFDELLNNKNWKEDEYKALKDFCTENRYEYDVVAVSFFTKQVAVKLTKKNT